MRLKFDASLRGVFGSRQSLLLCLLALALVSPAFAQQYEGTWRGTTGEGTDILFRVVNNAVTYIRYDTPCPQTVHEIINTSIAIGGENGNVITGSATLFGTFSTDRDGQGTLRTNISQPGCTKQVNTTWTAKRAVPTAAFRDKDGGVSAIEYLSSTIYQSGGAFAGDPNVAQSLAGDTYVASRDTFGAIWANVFYKATKTWGTWAYGGGAYQGTPAIAVGNGNTAYLACRDQFNAYWLLTYTPAGGIGGATFLGGIFGADPKITAAPNGTVYIIGQDQWNSMWSGTYTDGGGFGGWVWGGGVIKGFADVTAGTDNAAYFTARDAWDGVWMSRVLNNTWTGWHFGGGVVGSDPKVDAEGVMFNIGEIPDIVMVALDHNGGLFHRAFSESTGNGWKTWMFGGGVVSNYSPTAVVDEIYVAAKDANAELWWYRSSNKVWTYIGQAGWAAGNLKATLR